MRFTRHIAALAVAVSLLPMASGPEAVAQDNVPVVRGEILRDFARVTFEWPTSVYVSADMEGSTLVLRFDRKGEPDFGNVLSALSPYVTKVETSGDGKTVRLHMNKPYRVRSFVSGNVNGVDILGIGGKSAVAAAKQPARKPVAKAPVPEARKEAKRAEEKPAPPPAAPQAEKPQEPQPGSAAAKPLLHEPEAAAAAPAVPVQEAAPQAVALAPAETIDVPRLVARPQASAEEMGSISPAAGNGTPPQDKPVAPPLESATPAPEAQAQEFAAPEPSPAARNAGESVKVFASSASGQTVMRFAWPERVAAATFQRGDMTWLVFGKHAALDLSALKETAATLYPKIALVESDRLTALRIRTAPGAGVVASKAEDSFEWNITLTESAAAPSEALPVQVNTEPPLPPHVFLPVVEADEAVALTDPDQGDTLLIVPVYKPGLGNAVRRNFVEFSLLASSQGVVLQRMADNVRVTPVRNGLRVGTERGLFVSPALPDAKTAPDAPAITPGEERSGATPLFPYESWKADATKTLPFQLNALNQAISFAPDADVAAKLRQQLAQLYLAEGLAVEALGVVREIKRTNPQYFIAQRLSAISGAANFMLHRFNDAAEDFSSSELPANAELRYWQSTLAELLGKPDQSSDYLAAYAAFLSKYPPRMQQQLAIIATDRAIGRAEYNVALQILDGLKQQERLDNIEDQVAFLLARISLETGKEEEALNTLEMLAANYRNASVRARAEFTLINHELTLHPEKAKELAPRLERLNLAWRGDGLEMESLRILGEIYSQGNDYVSAMRSWRQLINGFPGTQAATEALSSMRAMFLVLFDEGAGATLPPLDQLSLYYEYRSLTPSDAAGDRIVNNIADRLVSMDLLEQAATLLDYRMRYLYEKSARSRTGAKLADVYLLNRQPEKALAVLQNSVYGDNPEDLRVLRDQLAARAMVEMQRYAEALELLAADKSKEAETIRQRAWWKQKDWPKLITSVEDEIKARGADNSPVTDAQAEKLVQLALAYAAQHDTAQLQYLRDYFTPLFKDNKRASLFDFITLPDVLATPEMFGALMAQIEQTRAFLQSYKTRPQLPAMPAPSFAPPVVIPPVTP